MNSNFPFKMELTTLFWNNLNVTFLVIFLVLLYLYVKKTYSYWDNLGIPCIKGIPFVGSIGFKWSKPFGITESEWYKKCGRIFGIYEGTSPVLFIAEPNLLRDIFVKDFNYFRNQRDFKTGNVVSDNMVFSLVDDDWKRVRSLITPSFSSGKMRKMTTAIRECCKVSVGNFTEAAEIGKPVDCILYFDAYSMDIIIKCAFGTNIDSLNDPKNEIVKKANEAFKGSTWRTILFILFPRIFKLFHIDITNPTVSTFFQKMVLRLIEERKQSKTKLVDFLQLMLDAESDEVDSNSVLKSTKLSFDELVSQCVMFIMGGYVTTSCTLSFIFYSLATYPEFQKKLREEINEILSEDEFPDYDSVNKMNYLDAFISEVLRYYCPITRTERKTAENYKLGDTGIVIQKDTLVAIPMYAMQHDPEFFHDPEKFIPERFLSPQKDEIQPYTYLPFGSGPRGCLGSRFAILEIKFCVIELLRQFHFDLVPGFQMKLQNILGIHAPDKILLKVTRLEKGKNE